ncbi:MAG: ribosome small subunit-dependent GTPase A [Spirochaetia bacterium]|nr:ribosome small subunit-dependent GTPase A [Spirochaetia bacterium]
MYGKVLFGINNIYTVRPETGADILCRIKGKVLKGCEDMYNPLTAGDVVEIDQGLITSLVPRRNAFTRWNRKRLTSQVIAANIDMLFCVSAPEEPPFRPRFLDKVIANSCCKYKDEYDIAIVLNKCDMGVPSHVRERLDHYEKIGIRTFMVSAKTGDGIDELRDHASGKTVAFAGQSGVGKSSLLNAFSGNVARRVGEISKKYNRGRHVTNYAVFVPDDKNGGGVIDTPGIREIFVDNIEPQQLILHFHEISEYYGKCAFSTCSHTVEKGCRVLEALEKGLILPDRYESYKRIYSELTEQAKVIYGKEYT